MDETEFKKKLNPEQYRVMREKGTETAFAGKYWDHTERGTYLCAACGTCLFSSFRKLEVKTGWPTFTKPVSDTVIALQVNGPEETEIVCKKCESHLGYIVREGKQARYQVNSLGLDFKEGLEIDLEELEGEEAEAKETEEGQPPPPPKPPTFSVKNIALFLAGAVVGATGLGVAFASGGIFQNSCPAPVTQNQPAATNPTPVVVESAPPPASATPLTQPVVAPVATPIPPPRPPAAPQAAIQETPTSTPASEPVEPVVSEPAPAPPEEPRDAPSADGTL